MTLQTTADVTATELCRVAGITYRQADFWTTTGRLHPSTKPTPGSGCARRYPPHEVQVARAMRRLIDAGMTVPAAHDIARKHVAHPFRPIPLGAWLTLLIEVEP